MQYQNITINHFRGIQSLTIEDLRRVNLLVGRNNCGKTTVLEAFFLLSGMSNPQLSDNIQHFRDLPLTADDDYSYLFWDFNFKNPISLKANLDEGEQRYLTIYPSYKTGNQTSVGIPAIPSVSTDFGRQIAGIYIDSGNNAGGVFAGKISIKSWEIESHPPGYKEKLRCAFLTPKTLASDEVVKRIDALIIKKQLGKIISVLQHIEPSVTDIRIGRNSLIYVDIGKPTLFPMNIMGDGIRRILSILAVVADMQDGVLLVDEIENGLHYSSLAILWKALFVACREYNVQLIATTHSYECIEAFSNTYASIDLAAESEGDGIRLYRLDRQGDTHQVFSYTTSMLQAGLDAEFEVR